MDGDVEELGGGRQARQSRSRDPEVGWLPRRRGLGKRPDCIRQKVVQPVSMVVSSLANISLGMLAILVIAHPKRYQVQG